MIIYCNHKLVNNSKLSIPEISVESKSQSNIIRIFENSCICVSLSTLMCNALACQFFNTGRTDVVFARMFSQL